MAKYDVKDIKLASEGKRRIEWAGNFMPVIALIEQRLKKEQPLKGRRVAACLHVTTETANLMRVLKSAGAEIHLCASNPLSTQDDVAAALANGPALVRPPIPARPRSVDAVATVERWTCR